MYVTTMGVVNKKLTILKEGCFADYKTGSVNIDRIVFNFSGEEWEGLTKIAVFVTKDGKIKDVPLIDDYCDVPIDIYLDNNIDPRNINYSFNISVGVYGQLIDDEAGTITKILPTNLVSKKVSLGSYFPGEEPSGLPTAEEWQLYIDEVGRLATEAKNEADRAAEIKADVEEIQRDLNELAEEMRGLETNTQGYANNAHSSMLSAESFANNSSNFANDASNFANNASLYANASYGFSNNASNYANSAQEASNLASQYANNSSGWANNAANYASNSANWANQAKIYMENASNWANASSNYANASKEYSEDSQKIKDDVVEIYNEIYDISAARMFAAFDVNYANGDLIMTTVQSLGNLGFALDSDGNLVVELN